MIRFIAILALAMPLPAASQSIEGVAHSGDGDSFTVSGQKIRLFGIDAPEYSQTCSINFTNWACGVDAAGAMSKLINNRSITCLTHDTDTYGRTVAKCLVDGRDVAAELVAQGYAIVLDNGIAEYAGIEAKAKADKAGIWASKFMLPAEFRKANPRQPATPSGKWGGPSYVASQGTRYLYRTCAQARAAGVAPMRRGTAAYNPNLDGDDDGFACEPYRGRR